MESALLPVVSPPQVKIPRFALVVGQDEETLFEGHSIGACNQYAMTLGAAYGRFGTPWGIYDRKEKKWVRPEQSNN
jgi:hypothetical protein